MKYVRIKDGMDYADENKLMGFANDIIESAGVVDLAGGDLLVEAQASPNMSVKVSPGTIYIENSSWVQNGNETHYFQCFSTEIENLNINSNSSGSERVDLICAKIDKVNDPGDYGELAFTLVAVEGTAGGGVPATPANHQKLAEIAVASGATSITSGDITDSRVEWTTKGGGDRALNTTLNIHPLYAPQGFLINGKIVPSVASNNLTVAIKGMDGNDPSATNPVYVRIGDTIRSITSALSVTKNAGTNWCNAGSAELATKEIDYFVYLGYNATDGVVIGFSRIPYASLYSEFSTTSTDQKYAGISTITNAAAGDNYANIGRFAATLSAGSGYTWTVPTFTSANLVQRPIYETRWLSWTPTFSANGSMTFTLDALITSIYKISMSELRYQLYARGTTGGTANTAIKATQPIKPPATSVSPAGNKDTGSIGGSVENYTDGNFYFYAPGGGNWGLGNNREANSGAFYKLA